MKYIVKKNAKDLYKIRKPIRIDMASSKHSPLFLSIREGDLEENNEDIFRSGSLLHHVQISDILEDGKEFVDRPALFSQNTIRANWKKLLLDEGKVPSNEKIKMFVEKHFGKSGWELEDYVPEDLCSTPSYIQLLKHKGLVSLAVQIQELWRDLGMKIKKDVKVNRTRTSMLYIPNVFVIPGGRFKVSGIFKNYHHCHAKRLNL